MLVKTPVTQHSPCYSAVSALLINPLPDCSNDSALYHTHYLTPVVSSGQTLYQAASWRLILRIRSSMLQCFTAELYCRMSSRELSALRKLNNKQRQVSMFLIQLLTQLPFVSFLFSVLPFSFLSLLSLPHPFFLFSVFLT